MASHVVRRYVMATEAQVADVLGISRQESPLWIMRAVTEGLPLNCLDRVVGRVAPEDKGFVFRVVPRPTLARRRKAASVPAVLLADEGSRVARLAEVWAMACDVWGSDEEARAFLFRPHPMLEDQAPIDVVLATEFGQPIVEGILPTARIRFSMRPGRACFPGDGTLRPAR
jgi:putative toxin-antitoxin system antitoxin component (TIGR02293 family)